MAFLLALTTAPLHASAPAVGLWEDVVLEDDDTLQLISHRHFIFTDQKLTAPTTFTALKDFGGEIDVFCCLEVKNMQPLALPAIEREFSHDHDFPHRFSDIHGLKYIYEAQLASRAIWNQKMVLLKGGKNDTNDIPFSAPVIAGRLDFSEMSGNRFKSAGGNEIELMTQVLTRGQRRWLVHRFIVDQKVVRFRVPTLAD